MKPHVQLLAYRFDAAAQFEALVGALERAESGGTLRIRDVLFIGRDPESGDLVALAARGKGQGSVVSALLGFRLDPSERGRSTERALRAYDRGDEPNPLRRLGETLQPATRSRRSSWNTCGRTPSTTPSSGRAATRC